MEWLQIFTDNDYWIGRLFVQKAIAFIYLISFLNARNQFRPLCGENGLLPAPVFLKRVSFRNLPGIFQWHYSDRFLGIVAWAGILVSLIHLAGFSGHFPVWLYMITWLIPWMLYLSIVNTGQIFWGYGWESMLLEIGFLVIFLGPVHSDVPLVVIWLICWMLFRVELGAGLIKIRGDQCWRDLTCLNYHHETQPLPNFLSRFFHFLPDYLHKIETAFNHFVQLIAVWGLFLPQPVSTISAIVIILSQLYLIISGNYAWLNWMTLSLAFAGISNDCYEMALPVTSPGSTADLPVYFLLTTLLLGIAVIWMSIKPVRNMISSAQKMNFSYNPLHLVNTYGAFGSVTKKRFEIVLEGTSDRDPGPGSDWKEYEFKGKPGNPGHPSPQVAPYHYRLDWQMWFAALRPQHRPLWMQQLARKLLENDPDILKLIKRNPFPEKGPEALRAKFYHYRYATFRERKESGNWWIRTFEGYYFPEISL